MQTAPQKFPNKLPNKLPDKQAALNKLPRYKEARSEQRSGRLAVSTRSDEADAGAG